MNYFLQGFGVFLGVIAGVVVTWGAQIIIENKKNTKKAKNLLSEFDLNFKKIDLWLEELTKYRNAVNSETMNRYFGYFDFSKFVIVTANNMFMSGLLYDYLSHEDISMLQEMSAYFTLNGEKYINDQIASNKTDFNKEQAVGDVDFHEERVKKYKKALISIKGRL